MLKYVNLKRYIAVHYPIDYSQAINSPEACKKRLFKYVIPVILASFVINAPRFFESEVVDEPLNAVITVIKSLIKI